MNPRIDGTITAIPPLPVAPPLRAMFQISMSPRPASALLSPSPRLLGSALESLTPDRQAVPFCSADDVKDLALPGATEVNVVDEAHADALFRDVSRKRPHDPFQLALPSPSELAGGTFSGSSTLPTPNLSQQRINQLQQRPSPPPLFQTNPNNFNMTHLIFASHTPPPLPSAFPMGLAEPELPDDAHKLRPLHAMYGSAWQHPSTEHQKLPGRRPVEDPSSSVSTLATSIDMLPSTSTDNDSESSSRSRLQNASWPVDQMKRERPVLKDSMPKVSHMKPKTVPLKVKGEQPQCDLCGAHFARRSNLYKHKRSVHVDHRQFKCDICSYGFKRQDHLVKHKRTVHSKERNFPCEICGTAFAEKYNRAKHVRVIHFTQRPFKCGCGAFFQHRDQMLDCLRCKR